MGWMLPSPAAMGVRPGRGGELPPSLESGEGFHGADRAGDRDEGLRHQDEQNDEEGDEGVETCHVVAGQGLVAFRWVRG